jgi:hypothetical protein
MRRAEWVLALILGLGLASPAWAQRAFNFGGAVNPQQLNFVPIDTSQAIGNVPRPQPFSIGNLFPKFHMPTWPPKIGQSPLPAPSSFPSTHYPNTFIPRQPVIPGNQ